MGSQKENIWRDLHLCRECWVFLGKRRVYHEIQTQITSICKSAEVWNRGFGLGCYMDTRSSVKFQQRCLGMGLEFNATRICKAVVVVHLPRLSHERICHLVGASELEINLKQVWKIRTVAPRLETEPLWQVLIQRSLVESLDKGRPIWGWQGATGPWTPAAAHCRGGPPRSPLHHADNLGIAAGNPAPLPAVHAAGAMGHHPHSCMPGLLPTTLLHPAS